MRLLGKNIAVFVNEGGKYKPIGLSTSCTIDINTDMIEMASQSAKAKAYMPGRYSYTVQIDRLVDVEQGGGTDKLLRYELNNTPLTIVVGSVTRYGSGMELGDFPAMSLMGEAYISHQSLTGSVDGHATHNVSMQGTGELDLGEIDIISAGGAAAAYSDIIDGGASATTYTNTLFGGQSA
jgi:predicted secreted protein